MAINGLTQKTKDMLYTLAKPNEKKKSIQPMLKKPEIQPSAYKEAKDALLSEYLDREPYDFNINTDKLYAQYADMYKKQGEAAMRDTVASAAEKTGGYSSSYGVTAGAQAYQSYLDRLNDIVPVLEEKAYDRYADKAKESESKLKILESLEKAEYEKHRDAVGDYKDDRDYYRNIYQFEDDRDTDMYKALTDYILAIAKLENDNYNKERDLELALAKLML